MLLAVGDLHIKSKHDLEFESTRLNMLVDILLEYQGTLVLVGDVFDSNNPSWEDIKLFYDFTDRLSKQFDILIISGNHDFKIFNYLPQNNFKVFLEPTTIDNMTFVPWNNLEMYLASQSMKKDFHGDILFTHARCTIEPFIKEEVDFSLMSSLFNTVILGDIHMPHSPYPNIFYTSEPSQIHYKSYSSGNTGFIILDNGIVTRRTTELPYRTRLEVVGVDKALSLLTELPTINRYKITVEDTIANLQKLKKYNTRHVKFEPKPLIELQISKTEDLKQVIDGKLSIEEMLFDYVKSTYKFDFTTVQTINRLLNNG
jgi:hypothetical protein